MSGRRAASGGTSGALFALLLALAALGAPEASARSGGESRARAAAQSAAISEGLAGLARAVEDRLGPSELEALFAGWNAEADRAREVISNDAASKAALEEMRERLLGLQGEAEALVARQKARLEPLSRELAALGDAPGEGEAAEEPALAALRARLNARISEENAVIAAAQLAGERFNVILDDLSALMTARLRERVLTRGPSPLLPSVWAQAGRDLARLAADVRDETLGAASDAVGRERIRENGPAAAASFAVGLVLFVFVRARLNRWSLRVMRDPDASTPRKIVIGVAATVARLALMLAAATLLLAAVAILDVLGAKATALFEGLAQGLIFVIVTYALATAYYAPDAPEMRLAGLPDRQAARARAAAMTLAWTAAFGATVVYSMRRLHLDAEPLLVLYFLISLAASAGLLRLRSAYRTLAAPAEAEAAEAQAHGGAAEEEEDDEDPELLRRETGTIQRQFVQLFRIVLLLLAVAAPALSAAGYFAASHELLRPALRSLGALGLCALLFAFFRRVALHAASRSSPETARLWRLSPLLVAVALIVLAAPLFAIAWGASWSDVALAARRFAEGAEFGGVTLSPTGAFKFVVVFALGYALTQFLKRLLRTQVLPELHVDRGARSALEASVGYVGIILAALMAITAAGLDLSSFAIVAGALSVGVGFGLQAIVSNFVSGLILLAERPIRVGDWIEVNGVHGTVRRVNVRSTEIETFDRSDYIVPNADLISQPVTNYTRKSTLGRLIVKVSVAYASDPREVEGILAEIAAAHPRVLRRPPPQILFRSFGADGLEFEIRAFLRDVNYLFGVGSDLHFEVARRFREAGIEIPFGQRDVWFRNAEALGEALRSAAPPVAPQEAAPEAALEEPGPAVAEMAPAARRGAAE